MLKHAAFQIPEHQTSEDAPLGSSVCHRSWGQTAKTRLVTANLSLSLDILVFKQSGKAYVDSKGNFYTQVFFFFPIVLNMLGKNICNLDNVLAIMIRLSVFPGNEMNYQNEEHEEGIPLRELVDSCSLSKFCHQFLQQRPCSRSHSQ